MPPTASPLGSLGALQVALQASLRETQQQLQDLRRHNYMLQLKRAILALLARALDELVDHMRAHGLDATLELEQLASLHAGLGDAASCDAVTAVVHDVLPHLRPGCSLLHLDSVTPEEVAEVRQLDMQAGRERFAALLQFGRHHMDALSALRAAGGTDDALSGTRAPPARLVRAREALGALRQAAAPAVEHLLRTHGLSPVPVAACSSGADAVGSTAASLAGTGLGEAAVSGGQHSGPPTGAGADGPGMRRTPSPLLADALAIAAPGAQPAPPLPLPLGESDHLAVLAAVGRAIHKIQILYTIHHPALQCLWATHWLTGEPCVGPGEAPETLWDEVVKAPGFCREQGLLFLVAVTVKETRKVRPLGHSAALNARLHQMSSAALEPRTAAAPGAAVPLPPTLAASASPQWGAPAAAAAAAAAASNGGSVQKSTRRGGAIDVSRDAVGLAQRLDPLWLSSSGNDSDVQDPLLSDLETLTPDELVEELHALNEYQQKITFWHSLVDFSIATDVQRALLCCAAFPYPTCARGMIRAMRYTSMADDIDEISPWHGAPWGDVPCAEAAATAAATAARRGGGAGSSGPA